MTTKRNNRVIVLVLVVVAIIVGSNVLMGRTTGDLYKIIDINNKADENVFIEGFAQVTAVHADDELNLGDLDYWKIKVIYALTDTAFQFPDNSKFELICGGSVISVTTDILDVSGLNPRFQVEFDNLGAVPQGKSACYVKVSGSWSVGPDAEGRFYHFDLVGTSFVFYVVATDVAKPNPVELTNNPIDITVAPYSTTSLIWNYEYAGTLTITVEDNGVIIYTGSVSSSVVPTVFVYSYYATISGSHEIIAHFLPMDSSGNEEVSDSMLVFITTGGDAPTFPPSVDRVDITVTQDVVGEGATDVFVTGWYSDVAQKGAYSTLIDGMLDVEVHVQPSGAFLAMKVMISDHEYPLVKTVGWDYDIFTKSIDTDVIEAGVHTVEVWGFDSDNAIWYEVGSFTIPIRTADTPLDPLIFLGIVVAIVGVIIVIFMVKRK